MGVANPVTPRDDAGSTHPPTGRTPMASKDKGGKSEKKQPKKNIKEKRAAKKAKKSK